MWLYIPSNSAQASACSAKASEPHSSYLASDIEPFATWNVKPLLPRSLSRLWKQEPLIRRLSGLTSPPSTAQHGADQWIASLRASRVKTCQLQVGALGSMARARASSSTSSTSPPLAVCSTSFWRTSQASLLPPPPLWTKKKASSKKERPPESWENWPIAGGMRSGSLFQRPTWVAPMDALDGSASHGAWPTPNTAPDAPNMSTNRGNGQHRARNSEQCLGEMARAHWATPNAHDGRRPGADLRSTQGANLSRDAALWATPTTMAAKGVGYQRQTDGTNTPILSGQAEHWPTPASRDFRTPNSQESQESRNHTGGEQLPNFVEHHFSHPDQATPDGATSSPPGKTSRRRLNPAFGCWLMGWPIWLTNPGLTSCAKLEMALYRHRLGQHLSNLCAEHAR